MKVNSFNPSQMIFEDQREHFRMKYHHKYVGKEVQRKLSNADLEYFNHWYHLLSTDEFTYTSKDRQKFLDEKH